MPLISKIGCIRGAYISVCINFTATDHHEVPRNAHECLASPTSPQPSREGALRTQNHMENGTGVIADFFILLTSIGLKFSWRNAGSSRRTPNRKNSLSY